MDRRKGAAAAVAAVSAISFGLLLRLIDRHAVDMLFWDQFDFLRGLTGHASQWQLFSWQHGPHRMGVGYLFIEAVYALSGWSNRAEAFATAGLFVLTLAAILAVKVKAVGPLTLADACLPALVFSRTQFELFAGTPNAAHGALPFLFVALAPLCWLVRAAPLRAALAALLAFASAFTGFALFLVPCLAALFAVDAILPGKGSTARLWDGAGALLCLASFIPFSAGYQFMPAAACYQFPYPRPLEYLGFAGLMLLRPLRLGHVPRGGALLGGAVCLIALAFAARTLWLVLRRDRTLRARATFLFSAFSLLFVASAAVGRICLGFDQAMASRYVPYVLPLFVAGWLETAALAQARPRLRLPAGAAAAAMIILQLSIPSDCAAVRWFSDGKSRWRACYLRSADERRCNAETGFRVYPEEGTLQVREMLDYLRVHRLNLYR